MSCTLLAHGLRQTLRIFGGPRPNKKLIFIRHKVRTQVEENGAIEETTEFKFRLAVREGEETVSGEEDEESGNSGAVKWRKERKASKYREVRNTGFDDPEGELEELYLEPTEREHAREHGSRSRRRNHRADEQIVIHSEDDHGAKRRNKTRKKQEKKHKKSNDLARQRRISHYADPRENRICTGGLEGRRDEARRAAEETTEEDREDQEHYSAVSGDEAGNGQVDNSTSNEIIRNTPRHIATGHLDATSPHHSQHDFVADHLPDDMHMMKQPSPSGSRRRTTPSSQHSTLIDQLPQAHRQFPDADHHTNARRAAKARHREKSYREKFRHKNYEERTAENMARQMDSTGSHSSRNANIPPHTRSGASGVDVPLPLNPRPRATPPIARSPDMGDSRLHSSPPYQYASYSRSPPNHSSSPHTPFNHRVSENDLLDTASTRTQVVDRHAQRGTDVSDGQRFHYADGDGRLMRESESDMEEWGEEQDRARGIRDL